MMVIKYRDVLGYVTVEVDNNGINFYNSVAYFSDVNEKEYKIPMELIEAVYKAS